MSGLFAKVLKLSLARNDVLSHARVRRAVWGAWKTAQDLQPCKHRSTICEDLNSHVILLVTFTPVYLLTLIGT